jgi:opacity protein-like surface antigen
MKKTFLVLLIASLAGGIWAGEKEFSFRIGFLNPDATETGFNGGFTYGSKIDDMVSIFSSVDYFYNNETSTKKYNTDEGTNINVDLVKLSSDIDVFYVPLMVNARINFPIDKSYKPYASGGIGWGLLWEKVFVAETEDTNKIDNVDFYHGLNWNISAGMSFNLGKKSSFFGEAYWNGGKMKSNREESDFGRSWNEVNMSGFGLRAGINFLL